MEEKNEGICRFCLKTFAGSAIGRHLVACKEKAKDDAKENAKVNATELHRIYHIRINSWGKDYWLHVEMPAGESLSELDQFLRDIWLECCGHLSAFKISGAEYQDFEDSWGNASKSMETELATALSVKDTFQYDYDFGSTTRLEGKVISERQGYLKDGMTILARNNPYRYACDFCKKKASDLCLECDSFICEKCLEDHECGEEMALPVVNSPRMGVCGYEGGDYKDKFEDSLMEKVLEKIS
jgi:hypothetical protein